MNKKIFLFPKAEADIDKRFSYIAKNNIQAAFRFPETTQAAFDMLVTHPQIGVRREFNNPKLKGMRMWPVPSFEKDLIFYHPTDEMIEVIRVLPSSRDIEAIFTDEKD